MRAVQERKNDEQFETCAWYRWSRCGAFCSESGRAQNKGPHDIDPTADMHPTVILEGKVTVGAYTKIDAGTVITGNVTIGHHTLVRCNVVIRGRNTIGNYTHIYDSVCIEGGRPARRVRRWPKCPTHRSSASECWINHGATMHGTQLADGAAVGLNACCDYNTRIGYGAILANGSATRVDQVIPENTLRRGRAGTGQTRKYHRRRPPVLLRRAPCRVDPLRGRPPGKERPRRRRGAVNGLAMSSTFNVVTVGLVLLAGPVLAQQIRPARLLRISRFIPSDYHLALDGFVFGHPEFAQDILYPLTGKDLNDGIFQRDVM